MANETAKVHWTQTPEGRARMSELQKKSAKKRLATMRKNRKPWKTPKQEQLAKGSKQSAVMKARWANAKAAEALVNGQGGPSEALSLTTYAKSRKLAAAGIRQLAFDGARVRREWLLRELTVVDMFLKGVK